MQLLVLILVVWSCSFIEVFGQCGKNEIGKRIVGGTDSNKHEFPWQAAIQWRYDKSKSNHVCGGSLIDPKFILTAAHCFKDAANPNYYNVTLGDHNRDSQNEKEQIKTVKKIIIHKDYNSITEDNDIALLELLTPVTLNGYVNLICLPTFLQLEFPRTLCTITGWGGTNLNKQVASRVLQKAEVPIVDYGTCNHERSYKGKLTANMFCAGYSNGSADTCGGDSGGPLQCKSGLTGEWLLKGITSWGNGCGTKHKYGVYTIVRHYVNWIKAKIGRKEISTKAPPVSVPPPIPTGSLKPPPIPTGSPNPPPIPTKSPKTPITTSRPITPAPPSQKIASKPCNKRKRKEKKRRRKAKRKNKNRKQRRLTNKTFS